MGLSASQARLLSITQRINNNELDSEFISNAKIQLSARNTLASEKYIAALDSTKMNYVSYKENGDATSVNLTFNMLTEYSPLKNQYSLYNNQGQLMVSEEDAHNFETTTTLTDFLEKYGLYDEWEQKYQSEMYLHEIAMQEFNKKMEDYNTKLEDYINKYNTFQTNLASYNTQLNDYNTAKEDFNNAINQYNIDYAKYEKDNWAYTALGGKNAYDIFTGVVGTSASPSSCYSAALSNPLGNCYRHVLAYLLLAEGTSSNTFTTTTGSSVTITESSDKSGSSISYYGQGAALDEVRKAMELKYPGESEYLFLCDGDDNLSTTDKDNTLKGIETPTEFQKLSSDYYIITDETGTPILDPDGKKQYGLKTLHQKAVDLMYIIKNRSSLFASEATADKMKELLINFTDGDMKNLNPTEPTYPIYNGPSDPGDAPVFTETKPIEPEQPEPPDNIRKIFDKEKAQWYTNLWYAMDGQEQTGEIKAVHDENDFSHYTVEEQTKTCKMIVDPTKSSLKSQVNGFYTTIQKANATDSSWIQFMLTSGMVTMKQASLRTTGFITWEGIEFSSTSDIREVEDGTKIAKAEAEYEEAIAQIQAEDKILDAKNKKLDTEHSALKAEIDSIKNVMSKNIEKSFNAFS